MEGRRLYPIGIQTFSKLREGNYVYVDKTELVYRIHWRVWLYILEPSPAASGSRCLLLRSIEVISRGERIVRGFGYRVSGEGVDKLSGASFRHEHGEAYGQGSASE